MGSLYNGLTEDGLLVSQVGEMVRLIDPAQTHSINRNRALFINRMIDQGFVNIVEYDEVRFVVITDLFIGCFFCFFVPNLSTLFCGRILGCSTVRGPVDV